MFRTFSLSLGALAALALTVHAEPSKTPTKLSDFPPGTFIGERNVMVVTPASQFRSSPPFEVSNVLWLNRCVGGCMVTGGTVNDARQHISTYIQPGPHVVGEYKNLAGEVSPASDAEWAMVVQCVKEIYSPFNIVVTETKPTSGNYTEAIVGGTSGDVGLSQNIGGVAPAHDGCAPNDNAMSYTFANNGYYLQGTTQQRVWEICGVVGQESAHHFGLDHAYEFFDKTSACNDPMTYRTDCGGQKFFRNKAAACGEDMVRQCYCGGLQNSHSKILNVFGAGQSIIPAPTVAITSPAPNGTAIDGQIVTWDAGSKRGVEKSELWLNGWKWAEVKGAAFGSNGQPIPSPYNTKFPAGVPNGVIDIVIKAYDDLGIMTESAPVTVMKGAPCANADACAKGQKCEAGKCFWDQPVGELGDTCDYSQYCTSNSCVITDQGGYCSQECVLGAVEACPEGYDCVQNGSTGACLPAAEPGGCCSAGGGSAMWVHGGFSLFVLGLVLRGRRRRRDRL